MPVANTVTVRIEGLAELGEAMKGLGDRMHQKISRSATRTAGELLASYAKDLAPENTGALKEAIQARRAPRYSKFGFEVVSVGVFKVRTSKAKAVDAVEPWPYYWRFIEFGTVKMQPRSFLRKAFDYNKRPAVDYMTDSISLGIEGYCRKFK